VDAPLITVLTPTYNRAHTLPRLARSLAAQGKASYEWLVVDDGSTDETRTYLESIERDGVLPLRFLSNINGGKHRAINAALPLARGRWTFIVDSDDALPEGALERITRHIEMVENDPSIGGIMGLRADFAGRVIGGRLPPRRERMSATDITFRAGIRGDKAELYRTDLLRRFPFPEFDGEKFITECIVWFRIARAGYELLLDDEVIYLCEYQVDGLSARSLRLRVESPQGTLLFYKEELELEYPARYLFREATNFCRFALLSSGAYGCVRAINRLETRAKCLAIKALAFGALAAAMDIGKLKRQK
jgi:glycosyltransferase involved in cell wall biosynthesis